MTDGGTVGGILRRVVLLVGPPGLAYQAVRAVLAHHPDLAPAPGAHLLTPLAHLGFYDKVYKAPYDHVLAAEAQRLFVEGLPRGEADYIDACRAYCAALYGPALDAAGRPLLLDATAGYARILPFVRRVLPEAALVAVTQHPFALLTEQDPETPPMDPSEVARYVEAVARHRDAGGALYLLPYEDLLRDGPATLDALCARLGIGSIPSPPVAAPALPGTRLGASDSWAPAFRDPARLAEAQYLYRRLRPDHLAAYGYGPDALWRPVEAVLGRPVDRAAGESLRTLRRNALDATGRATRRPGPLNRLVRKVRLACDVLLRT